MRNTTPIVLSVMMVLFAGCAGVPLKSKPDKPSTGERHAHTVLFADDFRTPTEMWSLGKLTHEGATIETRISDGAYYLDLRSPENYFRYEAPDAPVATDVDLQARFQRVRGPTDAGYGLFFRMQSTTRNQYQFVVSDYGQFAFFFYDAERATWDPIVDWTQSSAVKEAGGNVLRVVAKDHTIRLFINGHLVGSLKDDRLRTGKTGITVHVYGKNQNVTIAMDDFILSEAR